MKPKKRIKPRCILCFLVIAILLFVIGSAIANRKNISLFANSSRPKLCLEEQCIYVQIADTDESRAKGLMYRKYMGEDKGMLFVFPEPGIYSFWMKNTFIPLDMIRLDQDYRILDIKNNAIGCTQDPCPRFVTSEQASYVLEINAGQAEKLGLKIGDKLSYNE